MTELIKTFGALFAIMTWLTRMILSAVSVEIITITVGAILAKAGAMRGTSSNIKLVYYLEYLSMDGDLSIANDA